MTQVQLLINHNYNKVWNEKCILRAALRKYQLDLEIAKKSNFSELAQNEALRALVTKNIIVSSSLNQKLFPLRLFIFLSDPPNQPKLIENERHIQRLGNGKVKLFIKK